VSPEQRAVQQLALSATRNAAITTLAGGVTATSLRDGTLTPAAIDALLSGLKHGDSRVRWWCIQILDHVADPSTLMAIAPLLEDPVPRVRRNAAHALGCVPCKPGWSGALPDHVRSRLTEMADHDVNGKVRTEAVRTLACTASPAATERRVWSRSSEPTR
jgi:hypothetical protein